jgi:hypothetical protein
MGVLMIVRTRVIVIVRPGMVMSGGPGVGMRRLPVSVIMAATLFAHL